MGHISDHIVKRSKVILVLFEQIWQTLSPRCCIPRFSLKGFVVLEKKVFKRFFTIYSMAAIFFNGAEPFEKNCQHEMLSSIILLGTSMLDVKKNNKLTILENEFLFILHFIWILIIYNSFYNFENFSKEVQY